MTRNTWWASSVAARAFSLCLASITAWPQSGATIAGTAFSPSGSPLAGAQIEAKKSGDKQGSRAVSSASGEFKLTGLTEGTYELSASLPGLNSFKQENIAIKSGDALHIDARLKESFSLSTLGEDPAAIALIIGRTSKAPPGPAPHDAAGKPDLSGVWVFGLGGGPEKPQFMEWAEKIAKERRENLLKDLNSAYCLPSGITLSGPGQVMKWVQASSLVVMLFEGDIPRQVFLDGRPHPKNFNPSFVGHSTGKWDGDTLVVDTVGLNDKTWLDAEGHPHTEMLHVIERFRRPDLGHLEVEVTIEDPGTLLKPWIAKRTAILTPDEEILEEVCTENNRDLQHMVGK